MVECSFKNKVIVISSPVAVHLTLYNAAKFPIFLRKLENQCVNSFDVVLIEIFSK